MSRLASLTPSRTRSSTSPSPSPSNSSQQIPAETTHHRMLKLILAEVKNVIKTWDGLVLVDGMKAAKGCIDAMTEMDNLLELEDRPERPELRGHLSDLYRSREALGALVLKHERLLSKLLILVDQAEKIFFDAYRLQGSDFAMTEPLWLTWTLEHFVNSLPPLLTLHNNHLAILITLMETIKSPKTEYEIAKLAIERWRDLGRGGERWNGVREWEEIVEMELGGATESVVGDDEAVMGSSGRKKGKKV